MDIILIQILLVSLVLHTITGGNNGGTGEPGSQKETDLTESFLQFQEYILIRV